MSRISAFGYSFIHNPNAAMNPWMASRGWDHWGVGKTPETALRDTTVPFYMGMDRQTLYQIDDKGQRYIIETR